MQIRAIHAQVQRPQFAHSCGAHILLGGTNVVFKFLKGKIHPKQSRKVARLGFKEPAIIEN